MLDLERTARASRRGIWGDRVYRIRNPDETWGDLDSVQLVEGRVVDAAVVRGTAYRNFARDWRRSLTFQIRAEGRRALRQARTHPHRPARHRRRWRCWVLRARAHGVWGKGRSVEVDPIG